MRRGFTIVELLVVVAVFVIVLTIVSDLFLSSFLSQRRLLAWQTTFEQVSFLAEYLSRSLRMAKKELAAPSCLSSNGLNYELTHGGQGIKFINSQGICQEFFLDTSTKRLKEVKNGESQYLTAAESEVLAFNLNLIGASQDDQLQPRVTLFLKIRKKSARPEFQPALEIQTTVSQRKLDILL